MVFAMTTKKRSPEEEGLTSKEKDIVKEVMERNDKALKTLSQM